MTALILDTSSDRAFLVLAKNGIVIELKIILEVRQLSTSLLPSIETFWQDSFHYIALGVGPGSSYTGTRIGAAVAKTLSFALNIPLIGFSSKMLPNFDQIAQLTFSNYKNQTFNSQIDLVYFSSTF